MTAVAMGDVHERVQEVDLSKLIDFTMTFQPLQLTLHDVLQRLHALEADNAHKTAQLQRLGSELDALRQQPPHAGDADAASKQQQQKRQSSLHTRTDNDDDDDDDDARRCRAADEHEAMWCELHRLGALLGEMQHTHEPRHSIDALYAARKRRESASLAGVAAAAAAGGGGGTSAASLSTTAAATTTTTPPTTTTTTTATTPASATTPTTAEQARAEQLARRRSTVRSALIASGERVDTDAQVPIGDIILSKAHEELPVLDATLVPHDTAMTAALREAAAAAAAADDEDDNDDDNDAAAAAAVAGPPPSSWSTAFHASSFGRPSRSVSASDAVSAAAAAAAGAGARAGSRGSGERAGSAAAAAMDTWPAAQQQQQPSHETHVRQASAQPSTLSLPYATASTTSQAPHSARPHAQRSIVGGGGGSAPTSASAFDSLRRDAADIAYLNRVVAEILDEMRTLQIDVEHLRARHGNDDDAAAQASTTTTTLARDGGNDDDAHAGEATARPLAEEAAAVTALQRRLGTLERALADVDATSQRRDRDLRTALDAATAAAQQQQQQQQQQRAASEEHDRAMAARLRALERDVAALQAQLSSVLDAAAAAEHEQQTHEQPADDTTTTTSTTSARRARDGSMTGVTSGVPFALLRAQVEQLQRQLEALTADVDAAATAQAQRGHDANAQQQQQQLAAELQALAQRMAAVEAAATRLDDVKADKRDVAAQLSSSPSAAAAAHARRASAATSLRDGVAAGARGEQPQQQQDDEAAKAAAAAAEALQRLADLSSRVLAIEARVQRVEGDKADVAALQRLRDDLRSLRKLMEMQLPGGDGAAGADAAAAAGAAGGGVAALERVVRELQQQLLAHGDSALQARGEAHDALEQLREQVELLDSRKADATLVANKAERDYVENALERLMREVEQVLNATNAGLIDTVDKSLNLLRDMLDGKATKHDIAQLQRVMAEDGASRGAADALTGFKGYRCLGCNRTVDTMRPRPQAAKLGNFVSRVAPNVLAVTSGNNHNNNGGSSGGGGGHAARVHDAATRAAIQQQQQLQSQQQQQAAATMSTIAATTTTAASPHDAHMLLEQRAHAARTTPPSVGKRASEPLPPIDSTAS